MTTTPKASRRSRRNAVVLADDACPACGTMMVRQIGPLSLPVNGEEITVAGIAHLRCPNCGETVTDAASTQALFDKARAAYRRQHDLLSAEEIRSLRERLRLTPARLARLLSTSPDEITRWESGRKVQTPMVDLLLRLLRDVPGSFEFVRHRAA